LSELSFEAGAGAASTAGAAGEELTLFASRPGKALSELSLEAGAASVAGLAGAGVALLSRPGKLPFCSDSSLGTGAASTAGAAELAGAGLELLSPKPGNADAASALPAEIATPAFSFALVPLVDELVATDSEEDPPELPEPAMVESPAETPADPVALEPVFTACGAALSASVFGEEAPESDAGTAGTTVLPHVDPLDPPHGLGLALSNDSDVSASLSLDSSASSEFSASSALSASSAESEESLSALDSSESLLGCGLPYCPAYSSATMLTRLIYINLHGRGLPPTKLPHGVGLPLENLFPSRRLERKPLPVCGDGLALDFVFPNPLVENTPPFHGHGASLAAETSKFDAESVLTWIGAERATEASRVAVKSFPAMFERVTSCKRTVMMEKEGKRIRGDYDRCKYARATNTL
jgi:hypothetical protein